MYNVGSTPVLLLQDNCKPLFEYEQYLNFLPHTLRFYITKFRTSAHSLLIQVGRYGRNRIPRNERICTYCNTGQVEDEYHFILECPLYMHLRRKFIQRYYYIRPSMRKLIELFKSDKRIILYNLALYLKKATLTRTNHINVLSN